MRSDSGRLPKRLAGRRRVSGTLLARSYNLSQFWLRRKGIFLSISDSEFWVILDFVSESTP